MKLSNDTIEFMQTEQKVATLVRMKANKRQKKAYKKMIMTLSGSLDIKKNPQYASLKNSLDDLLVND